MHVVVIVLLVLYVLGLFGSVLNRAWAGYGPYFNLIGAVLLVLVVVRVFGIG